MFSRIKRYARWLHTGWPAGTVEKLPEVRSDGSTALPGLYVVGDLTGVPLLKFAADSGARAVRTIAENAASRPAGDEAGATGVLDLVIVGGGVAGMAAALEARRLELNYQVIEAAEPFSTLVDFPRGKPIYSYPTEMAPAGELRFTARVKEPLIDELRAQTLEQGIVPRRARAERISRRGGYLQVELTGEAPLLTRAVIVAIGRSGNFRRLGVPGEDLDKVYNRLHDPGDFRALDVLVVGGGDSALEAAIAIARAGGRVTLSYRKKEFSRPRPENVRALLQLRSSDGHGSAAASTSAPLTAEAGVHLEGESGQGGIQLMLGSEVVAIEARSVTLRDDGGRLRGLPNDVVFRMIGREAPLEFFRRSGVPIRGELGVREWAGLAAFLAFCIFLYNWKAGGALKHAFEQHGWFPFNVQAWFRALDGSIGTMAADPSTLLGTTVISLTEPGFYYSLAYTALVVIFGVRRIRRRRTPYVTAQTVTLMLFQCIPLFLLPYLVLPYLGHNGAFDAGFGKSFADALFPAADYGQGREYWRAFGIILAWPLFIWNVFNWQPMGWWLAISAVQTFVIIPGIVYFWGKGAYCGWVCSCGALAETLGDAQRQKMPHGSRWNRLNLAGQVILAVAFLLLGGRLLSWAAPGTRVGQLAGAFYDGALSGWKVAGVQLNYYWWIDVTLAGIVGVGLYFWFSGRVWCRFFCPLAALMHIYARFSRFRILSDKKKCISCNVCTSVCHQGIDVMSFANKGLPMADPQCVRCSACVQSCPTGVLEFGQVDPKTGRELGRDRRSASLVRVIEKAEVKSPDPSLPAFRV